MKVIESDWMRLLQCSLLLMVMLSTSACHSDSKPQSLKVTATAYTSSKDETDSTPFLAAWGDTLKPGTKVIAVSRDLIQKGLSHGVKVSIDGLDGEYTVLDKMNKRWRNKIDIYMGMDKQAAIEWGKRQVVISWDNESS